MKILMMTNTFTPIVGGLEKSIQVFSEQFRLRGHEVKIVAPEFEKRPAKEKDVVRVPALEKFVGTNFSISLPLPGIIQELVEQFKPDIVHSHHPFVMGDLALRLCGQNKIPLVFTYHTMFEHYTDHFAMDKQPVQQFVIELATGYANMADQIIAPSESVAKMLGERKVTTPIAVVPTGIDIQHFAPAPTNFRKKFKIPQPAFVIGHTGRLAPEKNLIFLTEAAADFLDKNKNTHFLVVGSGPSEREMKKIFNSRGVLKKVHFAGVLRGDALVEAYHVMNAFAFASKSETQGIVVAEAMAAGLPVVGLDAPGVREVVKDKVNGRLLLEESREKFAEALQWCATRNATQWKRLQKGALETANSFSAEICADKALEVYTKVVLRHDGFTPDQWNSWGTLLSRFKIEMGMLFNFGKAAGSAVVKSAVGKNSPKDGLTKTYEDKIRESRHSWMLALKKLRKKIQKASAETKVEFEKAAEEMATKIRTHESELTDLNRKALNACENFEKYLEEANAEIKNASSLENNHAEN